jgi:3-oxoacyl-[acyl-carrier protein] reductase
MTGDMNMDLTDKVALVTGSGSGMGKAIALGLGREGAKVGVNDIQQKGIDDTLVALSDIGATGLELQYDVGDANQVKDMFEKLKSTWGTIDILVNNAGIAIPSNWEDYKEMHNAASLKVMKDVTENGKAQESMKITSSFKDEWWHVTLKVHLDGTFFCTREALKIMEKNRSGKIINMSSVNGIHGGVGVPAYSAAKGAIIAFTKSVAQEVIGSGIIVNSVAPGYIDTPLLDNMDETVKKSIMAQTPAGRLGTSEEIASLVVYLSSEQSNFIVGQVISPNGGIVI